MVNIDTIQKNYPLHWLVWNNNYVELEEELSTKLVGKMIKNRKKKGTVIWSLIAFNRTCD